ncbi:MAG TPA: hypothetical protein VJ549_09310 [Geothrix sp.]|nr:hypothetical protein [Geothrix sp.]
MRHGLVPVLIILLSALSAVPARAEGGLDAFLRQVNVQARADLNGFSAKVSAQFGVPEAQVRVVLGKVSEPADAFMVFQLGQMTRQPTESVMRVYQTGKGRGWGALAQELGIKPGSPEFHALKRGDLHFGMDPGDQPGAKGHGKGKGHGRGHQ